MRSRTKKVNSNEKSIGLPQKELVSEILRPGIIAGVASLHTGLEPRSLPLDVAVEVIKETGSVAMIYHVPRLRSYEEAVTFEGASLSIDDTMKQLPKERRYIFLASTSRAKNSKDALEIVEDECEVFGFMRHLPDQSAPIIKLDIFAEDRRPIHEETILAANELVSKRLAVIPIISPDLQTLERCIDIGVPAIRLLTGQIRSMGGIESPELVRHLAERSKVPLIFEGGLGTPEHVKMAFECGATAVLVNTAFHASGNPIALARDIRKAIDSAKRE